VDFHQAPFLVIWETTRSCGLACKHCRADAMLRRDPLELSTEEGKSLLDQVSAMGTPICILSGGDPLNRQDLEVLISHGKRRGLRIGTIPAATENLTHDRVHRLKEAGLDQIAFSLDAPTAALHDAFRGVNGAFAKTMDGIASAHEVGLPVQINTCFAAWNVAYLDQMIALVQSLRVVFWEVFFLIPIGRGRDIQGLSAAHCHTIFEPLYRLGRDAPFIVKLTEAQHYRHFVRERESSTPEADSLRDTATSPHLPVRYGGINDGLERLPQAVNAGKGLVFVDHVGNIAPSGFLPISVENIRHCRLADTYQKSGVFRSLRNPKLLQGACGTCALSSLCGGSRARAYATTGNYLAEDPFCARVVAAPAPRTIRPISLIGSSQVNTKEVV